LLSVEGVDGTRGFVASSDDMPSFAKPLLHCCCVEILIRRLL
jgi:hypothetical protein